MSNKFPTLTHDELVTVYKRCENSINEFSEYLRKQESEYDKDRQNRHNSIPIGCYPRNEEDVFWDNKDYTLFRNLVCCNEYFKYLNEKSAL